MRDVNTIGTGRKEREKKRFYLNYEGCKRTGQLEHILRVDSFYLNYEGCKH